MNCKKAMRSILTDYLDGQIAGKEKELLEEHLSLCRECSKFLASAKESEKNLFQGLGRVNPPEHVWRRIRETILAGKSDKPIPSERFFDILKKAFYIPRPALAILGAAMFILVVGTALRVSMDNRAASSINAEAQAEYLDYLVGSSVNGVANYTGNFGTSIEQYFL
jgi:anti-sigma factor RsiW